MPLLLLWAWLLPEAARQVWRLKWVLIVLFVADCIFVSLDLAVIITLRLILLAGAFALSFATTTPTELRLAQEWLRVPYRYAFSLSLAFQSVALLDDEWWAIVLLLHVKASKLKPETRIVVASSSRDKSAALSWAEVDDPANWVMFDLSGRGTLKLVSVLERLDVRDEWVQDVDSIEVTSP